MKKLLLTLLSFVVGVSAALAAEVYTCQFGSSYNSEKISAYDKSWTVTVNDKKWDIVNFNNNNNNWNYVKCGRKNSASVASIATTFAAPEVINKVTVTVDDVTASKVNSFYLVSSSSSDFSTETEKVTLTIAKGANTFNLTTPTANLYYKIVFDCASGTGNGLVQVSKIVYEDEAAAAPSKENVELSWDPSEATIHIGDAFNAPILKATINGEESADAKVAVSYESSNTGLLQVANDGTMTLVEGATGFAEITAKIADNDTYKNATAVYKLTVLEAIDPNAIKDVLDPTFFGMSGSGYTLYNKTSEVSGVSYTLKANNSNGMQINTGTGSKNNKYSSLVSTDNPNNFYISSIVATCDAPANAKLDVANVAWKLTGEGTSTTLTEPENSTSVSGVVNGGTVTFTPTGDFTYFYLHTSGNTVFTSIEVHYRPGVKKSVEMPEISIDENDYVTITCATEGAKIYYTLDDIDPTAEATEYTAPFLLTQKAAVKAIAIKDGESSYIATANLTPTTVSSIAAFLELQPTTATKINANIGVIYQNGNYLFIKDANDTPIQVYGSGLPTGLQKGEVYASITGSYITHNVPALDPTAIGEKLAETWTIEPTTITLAELNEQTMSAYVKVEGLTFTAASKNNNYTAKDAQDNKANIYNQFNNVVTVPTTGKYDVVGFVNSYNGTVQILPIEFTEVEENPEPADETAPFNFADFDALSKKMEGTVDPNGENNALENEVLFNHGPIQIHFQKNSGDVAKWVKNGDKTELQFNAGTSLVVYVTANKYKVTSVTLVGANSGLTCYYEAKSASAIRSRAGETEAEGSNGSFTIPADALATSVTVNATSNQTISAINVGYAADDNATSGVENVEVEVNDAPAVYYNLGGQQVEGELAPGLYIRRQGSKAEKVIIR